MKQNYNIISIIKTKIGNFLLEFEKDNILKFVPTKRKPFLINGFAKNIENHINNYFSGKENSFSFRIKPNGTNFQKKVWLEILKIKYGQTCSYFDIANKINTSPRAVGNACGKNPCLLFIPCHRIIHKNNVLGNYQMGINIKKILLKLEKEVR